jgi:hypothetical protein
MNKLKVLSKKDQLRAAAIRARIVSLRIQLNLLLTIPMSRPAGKSVASQRLQAS